MIVRTRSGEIEHRTFALADLRNWGYRGVRDLSPGVTEGSAKGVPALHRAARLRAEALASLKLRCWRGEGPDRERVETTWQARLFRQDRYNEHQTRFSFWETVGESLAWRNKACIFKLVDPLTSRVVELWALHPDQVVCRDGYYEVRVMSGYLDPIGRGPGTYEVGTDALLLVRGHGEGGQLEPPTPFQLFAEAMASSVGRQKHETRMWRRGTALQVAIQFPQGISAQDAQQWKTMWRSSYEGLDGETTAVIGDGAEIKPIGMTLADAAYVEMAKLTVHDAARIMGVPANLLGAQTERTVPNLEQDLAMWLRFGLGPELERIESALAADHDLFGQSPPNQASVYPAFDTESFVRGDIMTEDNVAHQRVQDGRLLVDEWRATQGLPPLPNGLGKIPQVVPVGGGANPNTQPQGEPALNGK